MNKFLSIQEAAAAFGISTQTLRRWEKQKKITLACRTKGNQRRYDPASLKPLCSFKAPSQQKQTITYAQVSSHNQKEELKKQIEMLEMYCSAQGWNSSITSDVGSGINYNKKGLKFLLDQTLLYKSDELGVFQLAVLNYCGEETVKNSSQRQEIKRRE